MSPLGWPAHVHAHKMNKIMKKSFYMYIYEHDRVQMSNAVVYRVIWIALGERGLVSGMNTIPWHVIICIFGPDFDPELGNGG